MMSTPSWHPLLRAPHPCDHLVQLYTDDVFLVRVVAEFMATGLAAGEAGVMIATPEHADLVHTKLSASGIDVSGAVRRSQLVILDAQECLAAFMVDGMPERPAFRALVSPLLQRARQAGYVRIRLFGEMVDLLWDHNLEATIRLEQMWNEVLADERVSLLCGYRIDNFDRYVHRGVLHRISRAHSHLIPVEDYERFDRAVERAYTDVFGKRGDAQQLRQAVLARSLSGPVMPSAQASLFALREVSPALADAVLDRAREHYAA